MAHGQLLTSRHNHSQGHQTGSKVRKGVYVSDSRVSLLNTGQQSWASRANRYFAFDVRDLCFVPHSWREKYDQGYLFLLNQVYDRKPAALIANKRLLVRGGARLRSIQMPLPASHAVKSACVGLHSAYGSAIGCT